MIRTTILLLALASSAFAADSDWALAWEPILPSRMQWVNATHRPTGRVIRLKCAWCVSDPWKKLKPEEAATARLRWAIDTAAANLAAQLYAESPAGIMAARLAEAQAAADTARQAAARIAEVQAAYPLEKLPTVSVTAAAAEIVK